jgi:GT2 family glycosyltransferase
MVDVLDGDARIGAVGPKIYYFSEPSLLWATGDMEGLGKADSGQFNSVREVKWIVGCALLMKVGVVKKIGLLDEDLFLYGEEDEYCTRMSKAGFKMYYVPASVVWHKVPYRPEGDHTKPYQVYYISRNNILVRRKKFKGLRFCISLAKYMSIDVPGFLLKYVRSRRPDLIGPALKGVSDGLLWCAGMKKAGENADIAKTTRPSS